jgi:hypothetical protein
MKHTLSGRLENVFKAKDYTNKKTGEVKFGKWQLQFHEEVDMEEGKQLIIHKVSIPDEKAKDYVSKIGEMVNVPVKTYIYNNAVGYYGV